MDDDASLTTITPPAALYGGVVKVRRGRKRRTGGMPVTALGKRVSKTPVKYDPSEEPKAVVPSAKDSRTYTMVKTVMSLMFSKNGGEYKIPEDTFKVANNTDSNCSAKLKAWASAVKLNFTAPTNETVDNLGTTQHAFAECMHNAILLAKGTGSPEQQELAKILEEAESSNDGVERIDNQISFILSLNVGVLSAKASDENGDTVMMGGGEEDDDEEYFDQMGGMNPRGLRNVMESVDSAPAPAASAGAGSAAPAAAPAAAVPQDVLVQVAAAPSLGGQLAIAQEAQGGGAGGGALREAANSSFELARAAFRLFLSPFRSCYRSLPEPATFTRRLNAAAEAVENRRDILPAAIVVSSAAGGLLMPGLVGGALTGAANTFDAVNAVLPSGLSIVSGAAGNVAAAGSLAMSAGRLGATAASVYVASRAVGALTNTGMVCAGGAAQLAVRGVSAAGTGVVTAIEGAPAAAASAAAPLLAAAAPALAAAPGAMMRAAAALPGAASVTAARAARAAGAGAGAAVSAGRRVGGAVQSAFAGIRGAGGGGSGGEQVGQLADANAAAVEAVMDAPDEAAAMAAAASGAASVRAAISAAGGSGAYAESAGNAIESRLKVLAGRKRRAPDSSGDAGADEAAELERSGRPAVRPRIGPEESAGAAPAGAGAGSASASGSSLGGGCPTCGSHGGSRKKRKSKAKKSRKHKKRASYRRRPRKHSKSHSPSEEIYASLPTPAATTSPRMESSGPPVRS